MSMLFRLGLALLGLTLITSVSHAQKLGGEIKIDGSSTVYLVSEVVSSNFKKDHPNVKISVGISGTGGGFKKFAAGETDISDASRAIKPAEKDACDKAGIEYLELQVAWDGLAIVIHPDNTWAKKLTVEQLRKIWHPDTAAKKWSDVDPSWPSEEIKLFGAGPDSGTFDYFTEAINGKEKLCRKDFQASEDDNNTVKGVAGNKYAMGFFGLAYYEENKDKLAVVSLAVDQNAPFITPNKDTVLKGTYKPLSRPLFIYVKKSSLARPEVKEFATYYLRRNDLVTTAKYVEMDSLQQFQQQKKLRDALK